MFVIWRAIAAVIGAAVSVLQYVDDGDMDIGDHAVSPLEPKILRLENLVSAHASLFKVNTGFLPSEFEMLVGIVGPVIATRARRGNQLKQVMGRPTKLNLGERLLLCVIFLRNNGDIRTEASY